MMRTRGRGWIGLSVVGLLLACDRGAADTSSKSDKTGVAKAGAAKSGDTKSGDTHPGGANSGDTKSGDAKSGDTKSGDAKSGDAKSGDAKPGDTKSGDARPGDAKSGDAKPGDAKPGDTKSDDAKPGPGGVAPLPGAVATAKPGLRGIDAFGTISKDAAAAMVGEGYVFAARYIRHSGDPEARHITRTEAEDILGAGLALLLVQEGRGWHSTVPTAQRGTSDGQLAVEEAQALGYPAGGVVFLDVESVLDADATAQDVITFATAWHAAVKGSFVPGYYVGPGGKLTAEQLGGLPFEHFWKSGTRVPTPAGRGYQLTQHRYTDRGDNVVGGVSIDYDVTQDDERGDALVWLAPTAGASD